MFINKIGLNHLEYGVNCQDYGLEIGNIKVVCDGCSDGLHTEVGAKSFCHFTSLGKTIDTIFGTLVMLFGQTDKDKKDYLSFTILKVEEQDNKYKVLNCGDGYIITEDINGNIAFISLDDGEYPKYYIYNYCEKRNLKCYSDGVRFDQHIYSKEEYRNVGIASDGLRYLLKSNSELIDEFISILKTKNAVKMKRFINRNQSIFKDDITIVF